MGGSPPAGSQQYPVPQAQPSPRGPSEGEVFDQLDATLRAVQRKRELEAEAERIERSGDVDRSLDRPLSRGERESDREHFARKGKAEARRLSSSVKSRKVLQEKMIRLYQRNPSKGLSDTIKKNNEQLRREQDEFRRTRDFLERNR